MNEKRIRDIIDIENQAEDLVAKATREAERIAADAEKEARSLIEQGRADAQAEAQRILASASAEDESAKIIAEGQQRIGDLERQAQANAEKALAYVLERVTGRA